MMRTNGAVPPAPLKTPRRRRVNTARREDLLAQVTDIFLAEGFTSVTVEDLTRRLRCSKSTLYGVGSTKEKLVVAATKHFFGSEAHRIEQAVAEQDDPQGKITTYLEGVAQAMRRNSPAFYTDMVTYAPTAEIYARNTARAAERIREMIDDGVRAGVFRATNGIVAAQVVALAIEAVQSGTLLERTGLSAAESFAELADLLFNGLRHMS
ncbi:MULTISPECIES: TetR/AcrR family transcriptional regulator [unclassified Streptomyces]|uniref:TetR/AcrR family transcriptional regulator n=1 Tax=unclassified Streptomyces TaxID=2593676 RepID=UPI00116394F4|nr:MULTISPECIES: TetR/AcrR family transcriptional regulator [unclassified Streptomyces]QDN54543.1 TetR/AcrR family transcriptional regulator [Streptomyces sp. S1D4-20]QDN64725.1 TetR/AcrR family transcriptional regulator [Streptomyces sp. S1D4-14]QDO47132.1 TetR/AcrR family transcriptional regulator [Streptomyces sp. RLB3-5]QDO57373.1 TetR/AcrR family transcriptional regulator [Streptomyces sp. RLB1-8]